MPWYAPLTPAEGSGVDVVEYIAPIAVADKRRAPGIGGSFPQKVHRACGQSDPIKVDARTINVSNADGASRSEPILAWRHAASNKLKFTDERPPQREAPVPISKRREISNFDCAVGCALENVLKHSSQEARPLRARRQ